jgi:hypothetical protein
LYARADICHRGHQTNNYAEVSMKILKEVVLERMRAYNPVALVEFIVGPLNAYYQRRLLDHAHNRHAAHSLLLDRLLKRVETIQPSSVIKVDEHIFQVPSATENGNIQHKIYVLFNMSSFVGDFKAQTANRNFYYILLRTSILVIEIFGFMKIIVFFF